MGPIKVVCEGDSLTFGYGINAEDSYPSQLSVLIGIATTNFGVSGSEIDPGAVPTYPSISSSSRTLAVDGSYNPYSIKNIECAWAGTNDLRHPPGDTPENTYNNLKAYCLARKAAGYNIVVITCLPASSLPEETRDSYNALIRAGYTEFSDALCDPVEDVRFDPTDETYYVDGLHLTSAGYAIIAAAAKTAIESL